MNISEHEERAISDYLSGELSREDLIDSIGPEMTARVDDVRDAVEKDMEWGLSNYFQRQ